MFLVQAFECVLLGVAEFSETPNQAYFTPTFSFVRLLFLLGILNYAKFFSADASQTP